MEDGDLLTGMQERVEAEAKPQADNDMPEGDLYTL